MLPSHPLPTIIPDRPLEGKEAPLINQLLSSIKRPDIPIENIIVGARFIAIQAGGRMGLSSRLGTVPKPHEQDLHQKLTGRPVHEAAYLLNEPSPFAICLGLAALNAGNAPDPDDIIPSPLAADALVAELGKGKSTGLVGEFPFADTLRKKVGTFHLFELKPVSRAVPHDQWEDQLAKLDVLALTGTTLLTRKMAWFLSRAPQAKTVIIGPSTPVSNILFEFGADYLCGSVVSDMEKAGKGIRAGLSFKQVKKKGGILFTQIEKPF